MQGIRNPVSLCIRIARDFPGIADAMSNLRGSALLIGPPGSGKTTLLRDLIRKIGEKHLVSVVDERGELFPSDCFNTGNRVDILTGCSKPEGIGCLLRTMGPEWIAVDEVTAEADCQALTQAGWCGVKLLATAHAFSVEDLKKRSLYASLLGTKIFDHIFVLSRDKSWREERMELWTSNGLARC